MLSLQFIKHPSNNNPMFIYIYGLVDPRDNQIRYVGKAVNPEKRLKGHFDKREFSANTHKNNWLKKLLVLGLRPSLKILETVDTDNQDWKKREIYWISYFDNLTNILPGGEGASFPGESNPFFGKKHSNETKKIISEHNKGSHPNSATRRKMSLSHIGKTHSEETKMKIGLSHIGKIVSVEAIEKMRKSKSGKKLRKEHREKISQSMTGKAYRIGTKNKKAKSKYYGVVPSAKGYFRAIVGKTYVGNFKHEVDAARAYDKYVLEHRLNRPLNF